MPKQEKHIIFTDARPAGRRFACRREREELRSAVRSVPLSSLRKVRREDYVWLCGNQ